jgi:hypothetical protein
MRTQSTSSPNNPEAAALADECMFGPQFLAVEAVTVGRR